jgi:hypothetical protein
MESLGPWKLIKAGFWVGIGFIVPSIAVYIFGTYLLYSTPVLWQSGAMDSNMESLEKYMDNADKSQQIEILKFREKINGEQLLILGVIENTSNSSVSSIRLEAELLDGQKQMVYECSEYISKKLKAGEKENFQIRCSCGNRPTPKYSSVSLRVVGASSY